MRAFSSKGVILRRQRDSADVARGLFVPKSRRNLSAASVLHTDEGRTTTKEREGLLSWLKHVFNKSAEDPRGSHVVDSATADATAQPETAVPVEQPGSTSRPVSFESPTMTFLEEVANERIVADEVHRERNAGTSEGAREYASPRHCRVPPKQPLLGSLALNRNAPVRAIAAFAPRNSRPPIREPNVTPEKRDERKNERKDRQEKKKKKPVVNTNEYESAVAGANENRTEVAASDNPANDDPDTIFRYEWGVKVAEASDDTTHSDTEYVTKQLWGVNLKQPRSTEDEGDGKTSAKRETVSSDGDQQRADSNQKEPASESISELKVLKDANTADENCLSCPPNQTASSDANMLAEQRDAAANDVTQVDNPRKNLQRKLSQSRSETSDNDYNVPADAPTDAEIVAWKNLVMKSRAIVMAERDDFLSADRVENLQMVSIRPEAPQPKLDVRMVRSIVDDAKDEETKSVEGKPTKSAELKRSEDARKFDGYFPNRKLYTASWQIRYAHGDTKNASCCNEPTDSAPVDATMMRDAPMFSADGKATKRKASEEEAATATAVSQQKAAQAKPREDEYLRASSDSLGGDAIERTSPPAVPPSVAFVKQADTMNRTNAPLIPYHERTIGRSSDPSKDPSRVPYSVTLTSVQEFAKDAPGASDKKKNKNKKKKQRKMTDEFRKSEEYKLRNDILRNDNAYDTSIGNSLLNTGSKLSPKKMPQKDIRKGEHDSKKRDDKQRMTDEYVRLPGDSYPYSREHLEKWRMSHAMNFSFRLNKIEPSDESAAVVAAVDGADVARKLPREATLATPLASGLQEAPISSADDAADALGLQRWAEAFSRLDGSGADKASEAARVGEDDASLRAYRR